MSFRKISANTKKALAHIIPDLVSDPDLNAPSAAEECDPKKLKIKEWLRAHGKTRQWLAEQCRVSIRTVHTWFAARGSIPVTQSLFIDKLMSEEQPWNIQLSNTIPVSCSETEMSIVHKFRNAIRTLTFPSTACIKFWNCASMSSFRMNMFGLPRFPYSPERQRPAPGRPNRGVFQMPNSLFRIHAH